MINICMMNCMRLWHLCVCVCVMTPKQTAMLNYLFCLSFLFHYALSWIFITKKVSCNHLLMQRPVHQSCGRVKHTVDGCLFVWTGSKIYIYILMYHGLHYVWLLRVPYTSCYCHKYRHVCISWASTWNLPLLRVLARFRECSAHVQRQATFWSYIKTEVGRSPSRDIMRSCFSIDVCLLPRFCIPPTRSRTSMIKVFLGLPYFLLPTSFHFSFYKQFVILLISTTWLK